MVATVTAAPKPTEDNDDDVVLVEDVSPSGQQGPISPAPSGGDAAATATEATDCTEPAATATTQTASSMASASPPPAAAAASDADADADADAASDAAASDAAASDADDAAASDALADADAAATTKPQSEPIVIDDEEEAEQRGSSSSSSSSLSTSQQAHAVPLSSTEPDSEIKIASVTTLGTPASASSLSSASVSGGASAVAAATAVAEAAGCVSSSSLATSPQGDMNLMITSVTSLQGEGAENGLQISSTFSLNPDAQQNQTQNPAQPQTLGSSSSATSRPSPTFNPGRVSSSSATQPVQNGETGTHPRPGRDRTSQTHTHTHTHTHIPRAETWRWAARLPGGAKQSATPQRGIRSKG